MSAIFKYYAIKDYHWDALEKKYLWFSKPHYFNDPFDSSIEILKKHSHIIEAFETKFGKGIIERIEKDVKEFGVCCFSTNPSNLHLWKNYSEDNKGYAIAYNTEKLVDSLSLNHKCNCKLIDVEYPSTPLDIFTGLTTEINGADFLTIPIKSILKDTKEIDALIERILIQKNKDVWEAENEKRIILGGLALRNGIKLLKNDGDTGYSIPLPDNVIEGVYFGSNMEKKHIERILEIVQRNYTAVNFYKTYIEFDTCKMNFEPYK